MVKSWYDQVLEKGMAKGQRHVLQIVLEEKFGPLSAQVQQRLDEWPAEQLDQLGISLLHAASLQDLGLEEKG
jgi:hypothetical protein